MSSSLGHSDNPTAMDLGRRWVNGRSCRLVPSGGHPQRETMTTSSPPGGPLGEASWEGVVRPPCEEPDLGDTPGMRTDLLAAPLQGPALSLAQSGLPCKQTMPFFKKICVSLLSCFKF